MADDFLCSEMLEIDEIDGSNIYFKRGQYDLELFDSMTLSDYIANDDRTQIYQLSFITGKQTDGRFMVTTAGNISTWAADDRAMLKVGGSINIYATIALTKAAMNGTDERMLIGYSDVTNSPRYIGDTIGSTSGGYNMWGILPGARIEIYVTSGSIYDMNGDCSGVANVKLKNFSLGAHAANAIYYHPTTDVSGVFTFERLRFMGGLQGANITNSVSNKVEFLSCLFTGAFSLKHAYLSSVVLMENCVFLGGLVAVQSKASTIKNCYSIDTVWSNTGAATITTCRSTDAALGAALSIEDADLWLEHSATDSINEYSPYSSSSGLVGNGTAGNATVGFHGQALLDPPAIGIGEVLEIVDRDYITEAGDGLYHEATEAEVEDGVFFGASSALEGTYDNSTDPQYVTEAGGGDYHEATVAEVEDGVFFGDLSALEGTYDNATDPQYVTEAGGGDYHEVLVAEALLGVAFGNLSGLTGTSRNLGPGVGNVIKDATYYINSVLLTGTFDEAARNTDPGIALVKLLTDYKILNVAKQGTYAPAGTPPTEPTLTVKDNEDGTATITISGSDAGTTNDVYVKKVGAAWSATPTFTKTGDGSSIETLASGFYYAKVESEGAGGVSPGEDDPVAFEMSSTTNYTAEYRVTGIESMGGSGMKRCVLERIEHPINPNVP